MPARGTDRSPAAAAGGACQLLDFFAVEQFVGVQFEVAAAAQRDSTATCVLQKSGVGYPDLTLALTPTTVAAAAFKATTAPPGASDLAGLGQAAYQLVRPAPGTDPAGPGPAVEIGWLSRQNQLMVVRYRLPGGQTADRSRRDAAQGGRPGKVPRPDLTGVGWTGVIRVYGGLVPPEMSASVASAGRSAALRPASCHAPPATR